MPDQPLLVLQNPPAAYVAGSGLEYGSVDLNTLIGAIDLAGEVSKLALESGDDVRQLKAAVVTLADVVRSLAGELYQVGRGIEAERISAVPLER